jgi:hypothetical protein
VGISVLDYFRVYNRYGQLVFNTSETGKGWDGKIDGKDRELQHMPGMSGAPITPEGHFQKRYINTHQVTVSAMTKSFYHRCYIRFW